MAFLIDNAGALITLDFNLVRFPDSFMGQYNIENSIKRIENYAFALCEGLTSITIPNSVTEIGCGAFDCCHGLTSVNLPNSITEIGKFVFNECDSLTSIIIPSSVTSIGWGAFCECTSLSSINIPNSVTEIGFSAFRDCINLTFVSLPDSVTQIGDCAFYGCTKLKQISIPKGQKSRFAQMDGLRDLEHLLVESPLEPISWRSWETCMAEWDNYLKSLQESKDQWGGHHLYNMIIKHKGVRLGEALGPIGLEITVEEYKRFQLEGRPLQDIQYWCQSGADIHEMIRKRINSRHSRINDYLSARTPRKGYYKVIEMEQDCSKEDIEWSILKCYYNYRTPNDFLEEIVEINYKPLTNKVSIGPKRRQIQQGDIIHVKEDTTLVDGDDYKSYRVVWEII